MIAWYRLSLGLLAAIDSAWSLLAFILRQVSYWSAQSQYRNSFYGNAELGAYLVIWPTFLLTRWGAIACCIASRATEFGFDWKFPYVHDGLIWKRRRQSGFWSREHWATKKISSDFIFKLLLQLTIATGTWLALMYNFWFHPFHRAKFEWSGTWWDTAEMNKSNDWIKSVPGFWGDWVPCFGWNEE